MRVCPQRADLPLAPGAPPLRPTTTLPLADYLGLARRARRLACVCWCSRAFPAPTTASSLAAFECLPCSPARRGGGAVPRSHDAALGGPDVARGSPVFLRLNLARRSPLLDFSRTGAWLRPAGEGVRAGVACRGALSNSPGLAARRRGGARRRRPCRWSNYFGRDCDVAGRISDAGLPWLLDAAASDRTWVKLPAAYPQLARGHRTPQPARRRTGTASTPFGPERLVRGSDWPHTQHRETSPTFADRSTVGTGRQAQTPPRGRPSWSTPCPPVQCSTQETTTL